MLSNSRRHRVVASLVGLAIMVLPGGAVAAGGAIHARAEIVNTAGEVVGWAKFTEDATGTLHVNVHVTGLTPGLHGIHIHNTAACVLGTTPAFSSAGPHHNPLGALHGNHAGDLPNLTVNEAGRGHLNATSDGATLSPGPVTLFDLNGSAIVIHANPDDHVTNPTGNSGARVACGVIVAD